MIDRKSAAEAFNAYTAGYDHRDSMILHKIVHTYRVAANCERIAGSLGKSSDHVNFAWFLGLLHDIGRFEQVRRYGTFLDSVSVDHAEFGADLLFRDDLLSSFPVQNLSKEWIELLETAIRLHNKLTLPEDLDERTRCFCDLIRDADKVDIFRVVAELPFEERIGTSKGLIGEGDEASDEVMECVYGHRCVPRDIRRNRFEGQISHCCLAFELVYPESREMALEQGYLISLLAEEDEEGRPLWNERGREQLRILRNEIEETLGGKSHDSGIVRRRGDGPGI